MPGNGSRAHAYHTISLRGIAAPGENFGSLKSAVMKCLHEKIVNIALVAEPHWHPCGHFLEALVECDRIVRNHGGTLAVVQNNERNLRLLAFIAGIKVHLSEGDLSAERAAVLPAAG